MAELARQISDTARAWTTATAPKWARPLLGTDPELVADLAIWRAGLHVPESDPRPTGPARYIAIKRAHQQQLHRRIHEVDGNTRLPQHRWAATVDRIDPRISTDPTWPIIATNIDAAARAGLDIEHQLTDAVGARPLPDEMPAAALWARLEITDTDPAAAAPDPADNTTHPAPAPTEHTQAQTITNAVDAALGDTHAGWSETDNTTDEVGNPTPGTKSTGVAPTITKSNCPTTTQRPTVTPRSTAAKFSPRFASRDLPAADQAGIVRTDCQQSGYSTHRP
ncbi:hypothetical protein [Nocardia salmonicida]|uniref:hypothetical protein n=1 Tax=Nocardia salmonicida TaxID=53431 RepID=UPI0037B78214